MNRIERTWTQLSGRAKAVLALILMIYVAVPTILAAMHLHMNYTDSVPVGLYREVRGPAEYAALCVPEGVLQHAMRVGLEITPGDCPGGVAPILKPVFRASVDSSIRYGEAGFIVAGKLLSNTAPKRRSRTGAPLAHYSFGEYRTGLWAISGYNPDSFDSRYFGPMDVGAIRFYAKPVWTK
jgi:conjugative transfer signal peptidase TraF